MAWQDYAELPVVGSVQKYQAPVRQAAPQAQPKKKNFWLDQVSTAGGILGGIGGSFIAPIAGTAGGAAAGSALGEALENLITGDSLGKNVVKEGVLGGVLGAGPIRGAKALAGGVKALASGGKAAAPATRTVVERGSQKLLGGAWGIKTGSKVGSETLTPQSARALQQFISKDVSVPKTANADMVAERLVNFRTLTGQNIDDIVKGADRGLSTGEAKGLVSGITTRIGNLAGIDTASPVVQRLNQQLAEKKTLGEIIQFRRSLDDTINFARNATTPDPVTERVAQAMRGEIDKFTSGLVPGLKSANSQYSRASKALDFVLPAAKNPSGVNILGNRVGGGVAQRLGSALGGVTGSVASGGGRAGIAARVGLGAPVASALLDPGEPQTLGAALTSQPGFSEDMNLPPPQAGGLADALQAPAGPFDPANIEANVQQILARGGDISDATKYIGLVEALQKIKSGGQTTKPLSAESSKIVSNAQTGIQALSDFDSLIQSDPSAFARTNLPGTGTLDKFTGGRVSGALGTSSINAARQQIIDVIARLRTGAAITNDEAARFETFVPQPGDSPETRQQKLGYLMNQFQMVANRSASGGTDLESALLNAQSL